MKLTEPETEAKSVDAAGDRKRAASIAFFASCVLFLTFFRAPWAFRVNWQNDDGCYLATLGKMVALGLEGACERENYYAPGASLAWVPAGLLAKILSAFSDSEIAYWVVPLVAILSFSFWGVALFLLLRWMRGSSALALFAILNAPLLYYAIHWPIMPHTLEFLLSVALFYFLSRDRIIAAWVAMGFLFFTRYNDAPAVLVVLGHLWDRKSASLPTSRVFRWTSSLLALAVICLGGWIAFAKGYGSLKLQDVLPHLSLESVRFFFLDDRSGMLWMSPAWVGALVQGIFHFRKLSFRARGALAWMLCELLLGILWRGTGGDFGYRYLIGSYVAALAIWLETARFSRTHSKTFQWATVLSGIWMTYLVFVYRTTQALSPVAVFHPGQPDHPELQGVPQFFIRALISVFDPEVYRIALGQQVPLVTLYRSLYGEPGATPQHLTLSGPPLLILTIAIAVALIGVILTVLKRMETEDEVPDSSATHR